MMNSVEHLLYALADYPQLPVYILTVLLKSGAILLLAVLAVAALQKVAPAKHSLILRFTVAAVALLPVLSIVCPGFNISVASLFASSFRGTISSLSMESGALAENYAGGLAELPWAVWLTLLWLAGVMAVSSRVALGTLLSSRVIKQATPVESGLIKDVSMRLASELGIRRRVCLAISDTTDSPFVFGVLRPTIVLPPIAREWSAGNLRMILLHELAHIKRNDLIWVYVSLFAGAIYWFNPLIWIVRRKLTIESDKACDDYVVCSGSDRLAYAQHLLVILRSLRREYATVPIGLGMARRTQMEGRLMSILSDRERVAGVRRSLVIWTTAVTLVLLLPLAGLRLEIQAADSTDTEKVPEQTLIHKKNQLAKAPAGGWPSPNEKISLDKLPEIIHAGATDYPEDARKAGLEGEVWVKALIDQEGILRKVLVEKSSGYDQLDRAAVEATKRNGWKPAIKDNEPVAAWITCKLIFTLDDAESGKSF